MRTMLTTALLAACLTTAGVASAQSTQPGLWEVSSKMNAAGNSEMAKAMEQAQKQMASLPPEQRKMMQEMMAKQGMNMSFGADGVTTIKVCITPEMANRPPLEQRQGCTYNYPSRSGNTHKFSFQCTQPTASSGEGVITFKGANDYDGIMTITTERNGKKESMNINTSGRFLGANCGAVKPFPMPK